MSGSMIATSNESENVLNIKALLGDQILSIVNIATLENKDIRDYVVERNIDNIPVSLILDTAGRYRDYKIANGLYDYTDMLLLAATNDIEVPPLDYLFVDEAQDLSRLSWMIIDKLAARTKNIIIAGDDKQTINDFAGADVDTFLHLPGNVEVLNQSYRTPLVVYNLSNTVMTKMRNYRKEGANWSPRKEKGSIKEVYKLPILKFLSGDWLILVRAIHQIDDIKDQLLMELRDVSIPFNVCGAPPVDMDIFRVIALFEGCKQSGKNLEDLVTLRDRDTKKTIKEKYAYISLLKKFISCDAETKLQEWEITQSFRHKLNLPWQQAMDKVPWYVKAYVGKMLPLYKEKGDALFDDVPIRIMTIHRAKGREATNVLVLMDVPRKVQETIKRGDTDDEVKVFYVAITRTKENLYLYTKKRNKVSFRQYL